MHGSTIADVVGIAAATKSIQNYPLRDIYAHTTRRPPSDYKKHGLTKKGEGIECDIFEDAYGAGLRAKP